MILKNTFLKNILTLLSGTVLAQAIPILISPILTRIYTPDEIGVYTIFFATVNIITIFSSGRFEQAILLPKHKADSFTILKLSIVFSTFATILLFILLLLLKNPIANLIGLTSIDNAIFLIPITSFFLVVFQSYNYWLNRNDQYVNISKGKIIQSSTTSIIHLISASLKVFGLVFGRVLGILFSSIFLFFTSKRKSPKFFPLKKDKLLHAIKEYKDFPFYTMPNAALNAISNNLPLYLLEFFYSAKTTGFYSWSVRIIQGPMGMITSSIQQVFFRKASELYNNKGNLHPLVLKMYSRLFLIGIIPYTVLFFFAPQIFAFIFGKEWAIAGEYTTYLIPWFFIMFLNSPITSLILILEKQKIYLFFEIILFVFRGLSLYLGFKLFKDAKYSVILYGIVGFIFNLLLFFYLLNISKNATKK